jgi:hypothetical protein
MAERVTDWGFVDSISTGDSGQEERQGADGVLYAVGNVLVKAGGPLVQQAESPDALLRPGGALYSGRSPGDACIALPSSG